MPPRAQPSPPEGVSLADWSGVFSDWTLKNNPALYWTTIVLFCQIGGAPPANSGFKDSDECVKHAKAFLGSINQVPSDHKQQLGLKIVDYDLEENLKVVDEDLMDIDENSEEEEEEVEGAEIEGEEIEGEEIQGDDEEAERATSSADDSPATPPKKRVSSTASRPVRSILSVSGNHFLPNFEKNATGYMVDIFGLQGGQVAIPWRVEDKVSSFHRLPKGCMDRAKTNAAAVALRGTAASVLCEKCAEGRGPFDACYRLDGYFGGSCANCQWDHNMKKCNHHPEHLAWMEDQKKKEAEKKEKKQNEKNEKTQNEKNKKKQKM